MCSVPGSNEFAAEQQLVSNAKLGDNGRKDRQIEVVSLHSHLNADLYMPVCMALEINRYWQGSDMALCSSDLHGQAG